MVGGMETRFQWRKAHSRTAKCEAFHIAPRLFFMFLFLIPFTIRQHCYPQEFSTEPGHALACFQCADTLLFAAKHAKGISLRYGVIVSGDLTQIGAHRHVSCLVDNLLM